MTPERIAKLLAWKFYHRSNHIELHAGWMFILLENYDYWFGEVMRFEIPNDLS